jgi:two-component system, sensor histidine kinase YesM
MDKKRFFPLQYKILLFSLVVIIIPITILGMISFKKFSKILEDKISLSNMNTVEQIGNNINFIVQNVQDISMYLIQNNDLRNYLYLKDNESNDVVSNSRLKIENDLVNLLSPKVFINSIYIKGFNGLEVNTNNAINYISKKNIEKSVALLGGPMWYLDKVYDYNHRATNVYSMVRSINDINNITKKIGIMKINVDANAFYNIYKDKIIVNGDEFFLLDNDGTIISATNIDKMGQAFDYRIFGMNNLNSNQGYFQISSQGTVFLVTYYKIQSTGWKIVNIVPLKQLLKENTENKYEMILAMILSFAVCVLIAILFSSRMLVRLKRLCNLMGKLENEDFNVYAEPKGNDEITVLYRSFNKMSVNLKDLINKVYTVQIKQREAELKSLQAQINPHFLFNTLDNIYWMGRMENAFETSRMVEALSKLFRLSLNSGKESTTVKTEIEHIKNYVLIQQIRFKDEIKFSLSIDNEVMDCSTLKLVLQPLIENSITHGIKNMVKDGIINVIVKIEGRNLIFIVEDNGDCIDIEEINSLLSDDIKDNRGFAIKNVNERIKLFFGDDYGLKFVKKGKWTTAIVTQPYHKEETFDDKDIANR